jgi:uncharacterized protein YbcI
MEVTDQQTGFVESPDEALEKELSQAVVEIFADNIGRGPTRSRAIVRDDTVVVILSGTLSKAEKRLVAQGEENTVITTRRTFQRTMRAELVAAVERLTGREVIAFMSGQQADPDYAAEVFVLGDAKPA